MAWAPVSDCADRTLTSACESCQRATAHLAPSLPRALSWRVALAHVANRDTASRLTIACTIPIVPAPAPDSRQRAPGIVPRVPPAAPAPNDSFRAPAGAGRAIPLATFRSPGIRALRTASRRGAGTSDPTLRMQLAGSAPVGPRPAYGESKCRRPIDRSATGAATPSAAICKRAEQADRPACGAAAPGQRGDGQERQ